MSISSFGAAGVRPGVCTSTTRPTAPYTGQIIYETDVKAMSVWNGSAWEPFGDVRIFSSSAARASAIPTPIEGLVTYLQDVDELEVYNGSSWLRLVVTSDDEGVSIGGDIFANTGNIRMNRAGGDTTTAKGGLEFLIDGTTYARLYQSAAGNLLSQGNINPSATNTYDLGTTSLRWRNIYTQDLHLSNGVGDYTIVEGEENLYLVNHKTNKSFKFALIEVSPTEVPNLSGE
jgi:hypothetical protein